MKGPLPGSTNYLGAYNRNGQLRRARASDEQTGEETGRTSDIPPETAEDLRPFLQNKNFRSQSVLSEEFREAIWDRVMNHRMSVPQVSRDLGVEMNRVGAIVRMKELEKQWDKQGKQLAKPYAKAVLSMLPQTPYDPDSERPVAHESINDLPVHKATGPQIFYPTTESRSFTRAHAAKIFDRRLLPADKRIPHPEMIAMKRDELDGMDMAERVARIKEREEKEQERVALRKAEQRKREEAALTRVQGQRWEFRFKEISVDDVGPDGRGPRATGFRYGAPLLDRKRAQVKIPRRVI